jgi:Zn-dependent oligopeptidase|tara:strand:- start:141 stop:641 length:501 start_codon:yes stop_codon:yes gene_type:complete
VIKIKPTSLRFSKDEEIWLINNTEDGEKSNFIRKLLQEHIRKQKKQGVEEINEEIERKEREKETYLMKVDSELASLSKMKEQLLEKKQKEILNSLDEEKEKVKQKEIETAKKMNEIETKLIQEEKLFNKLKKNPQEFMEINREYLLKGWKIGYGNIKRYLTYKELL